MTMATDEPDGQRLLKEGYVYRGDSYISDDVVEVRYGLLWSDGLVTKRRPDSSGNGKVWPLNRKCRLKSIEEKDLTVLRSSHTLLSLAYGKYDSRKLFAFKVHWHSRGMLSKESLVLAFEDRATATDWWNHFDGAIQALQQQCHAEDAKSKEVKKALKARQPEPRRNTLQDFATGNHDDWTQLDGSLAHRSYGSSPPPGAVRAWHRIHKRDGAQQSFGEMSSVAGDGPSDVEMHRDLEVVGAPTTSWDANNSEAHFITKSPSEVLHFSNVADLALDEEALATDWTPFRILNGLAVYKEDDNGSGQGGAYMLSGTMKSSPDTCFQALMDIRGKRSNIWAFTTITKVIRKDAHTTVFRAIMRPQGSLARFLKQREVVLQRSWRLEEDGSYYVVFASIEDDENFPPARGLVRAHIDAMNFTIAPLKTPPSLAGRSSVSAECLVTVVLKVDFGGIFSRVSWFQYLFWVDAWERAWIETLLMTVVALRDKVEQDRFVVRPEMVRMGNLTADKVVLSLNTTLHGPGTLEHPTIVDRRTGCLMPLLPSTLPSPQLTFSEDSSGTAHSQLPEEFQDARPTSVVDEPPASPPRETPPVWLNHKYWTCPGKANFKVRGPTYLTDKKKIPTQDPVFTLQGVELVKVPTTTYHVSRFLPAVRHSVAPFNFVLCFQLPFQGNVICLALIFAADYLPSLESSGDECTQDDNEFLDPFNLCMARFLAGDDPGRNAKLKLIPSLAVGSWIMRQAVGQTPVMLGKKLRTEYFKGEGYLEADIDISSNSTAANVTSMVAGAIKNLVFDIGILLEGHHTEELPERLLGSARLVNLDLKEARHLDMTKELEPVRREKAGAATNSEVDPSHLSKNGDGHQHDR